MISQNELIVLFHDVEGVYERVGDETRGYISSDTVFLINSDKNG